MGQAWLALKGWSAPEVWTSLHPALALAKSLRRYDALLPILTGLAGYIFTRGGGPELLPWAEEMLAIAKETGDGDLLVSGHGIACMCYGWAGEFTKAVEHADAVMGLYDADKHSHLAHISQPGSENAGRRIRLHQYLGLGLPGPCIAAE